MNEILALVGVTDVEHFKSVALLVVSGLLSLKVFASLIVSYTNTPRDDQALAIIYPFLEKLAGILTPKAKQLAGEADVTKLDK